MTPDQTMVVAWLVFTGGLMLGAFMLFEAFVRYLISKIGYASVMGTFMAILLMMNLKW